MAYQEIINYIIIPLTVSLFATFLIWFFSHLYTFGARSKIHRLLLVLRDESIAFEKYIKYQDYDNALQMTRRIMDNVISIFDSIKLLTYSRRKRLLIYTLLNNIYFMCHRFTQQEVGYEDEKEKKACCRRMYKYIFVVGYDNSQTPNPFDFGPVTSICAKVLIDLNTNRFKSIKSILLYVDFNATEYDINKIQHNYFTLIDVQVFKNSFCKDITKNYFLTTNSLTEKAYKKIIGSLKLKEIRKV